MNKPSVVKFTAPHHAEKMDKAALEQIELLKKDLEYILTVLEKRINNLEG